MKNRGQVAVFAILGVVIIAIVITLLYLTSSALRKEEPLKQVATEEELSKFKVYVTTCLEDSLENAVSYCSGTLADGGPKCSDYEADIAERVKENFCDCVPECTDFSAIKNAIVEIKGEMNVKAKLIEKKKLTVTMEYPLLFKKGDNEHLLGTAESPFSAEYALEQAECVPIELVGNDHTECIAAEYKKVEILGLILEYNKGDKVAIGGTCIAC